MRLPLLGEPYALPADDVFGVGRLGRLEAGAHDHDVDGAGDAVLADHLVRRERGDRRLHHLDVGPGQRGVVVVGEQEALTARLVVRDKPLAERLVGDLPRQVVERGLADRGLAPFPVADEHREQRLEQEVDTQPGEALEPRRPAVGQLAQARHGTVATGDDEGRRPLVQIEMLHDRGNLRHELHGRCSGPHDAHPFSRQIETVLPTRGMEDLAAKGLEAREVRDGRLAQRAGGPHQHRCAVLLSPGRAHGPASGAVVPPRLLHGAPEAQGRAHVESVHTLAQVVPDFALRGEGAGPIGIESEGERVEVGRDVARGAGVGVVAPGAAKVVAAVEDHEVVDAHGA